MGATNWIGNTRRVFVILAVAAACQTSAILAQSESYQKKPTPTLVSSADDSAGAEAPEAYDPPPWVLFPGETVVDHGFSIDYRYRVLCDSRMAYEIGTTVPPPAGHSPLSMLEFPLNSSWNGVQVGVDRPTWGLHGEWMTAMTQSIDGRFEDYDWRNVGESFTDLGYGPQRWNDAQMVTLDLEGKLTDKFFGLPVEVWPTVGFRWQRFDITSYDLDQVMYESRVISDHYARDVLTFNQQYYTGFIGGQLRKAIPFSSREVRLTFQGDWGYTWAYGVDHHLLGDFYGINATQGGTWHIGLTAEVPISKRVTVGVQGDYLNIQTTGKTWEAYPDGSATAAWTNGVCAYSQQTMITGFVRLHY